MASSSRVHAEREPFSSYEPEGFDDFTIASSWERFISEMEAMCRLWLADGPNNLVRKNALQVGSLKNLYKVKFDSKYSRKSYCLEYYFELHTTASNAKWKDELHSLQLQFGVKEFLVISPLSASGVILDEPEATKLLSSVAIALSNCGCNWPAFVPVHDPTRKAYIGIQNMGMIFTRRFEADRIGSQVPIKFMHLEGLYELFLSKFAFAQMDYAIHPAGVHFTMRLTYRTPPYDDDDNEGIYVTVENSESNDNSEDAVRVKTLWDDDCPWAEWYSAEDPLKGFELIATWSKRAVGNSSEMAEFENASTNEADHWYLVAVVPTDMNIGPNIDVVGFASQLQLLVNALNTSFNAKFIEDFVSADNQNSDNVKSSTLVPPPTVLDRVLKDLFHAGLSIPSAGNSEHKLSKAIKGAPLESLFAQFCLHSLWFGMCHIRAISVLWIEFVREVRWCWEESQPLPRMVNNGVIDLSSCLIHQKLQMLAFCIEKKRSMHERESSCVGNDKYVEVHSLNTEEESNVEGIDHGLIGDIRKKSIDSSCGVDGKHQSTCSSRRGSAGVIKDMMLLKSHQMMHAPITQDPPLMTEDMHEERLQAIEAFSTTTLKSFSAQLEKDTLSSDMSAFKAANPNAVFEDFIRWHSPGDWESEVNDATGSEKIDENPTSEWPPKGKLSERMSEYGNSWRQIWNEVPALASSEQKPILDPNREGEKVLHYLETLRPHQLLEQMVCTAFRASADSLNQTSFGHMNQMKIRIEQLYRTIASALKSLKVFHEDDKDDLINDLVRLCHAFHQVEQLLIFAASVHRKLLHAPRLCQGVFDDYYKFYARRMGTSSTEISNDEEFHVKKHVRMHERDTVSDLFRPPTANQSWRKVLSMGNLLNGHEPLLRELIFSVHKSMSGNHYGTTLPNDSETDIETHRMYICGTSNDLQVALSVTSCD